MAIFIGGMQRTSRASSALLGTFVPPSSRWCHGSRLFVSNWYCSTCVPIAPSCSTCCGPAGAQVAAASDNGFFSAVIVSVGAPYRAECELDGSHLLVEVDQRHVDDGPVRGQVPLLANQRTRPCTTPFCVKMICPRPARNVLLEEKVQGVQSARSSLCHRMVGLPGMETTVEKVSSSTTRVSIMHFTHASMISLLCDTTRSSGQQPMCSLCAKGGKGISDGEVWVDVRLLQLILDLPAAVVPRADHVGVRRLLLRSSLQARRHLRLEVGSLSLGDFLDRLFLHGVEDDDGAAGVEGRPDAAHCLHAVDAPAPNTRAVSTALVM